MTCDDGEGVVKKKNLPNLRDVIYGRPHISVNNSLKPCINALILNLKTQIFNEFVFGDVSFLRRYSLVLLNPLQLCTLILLYEKNMNARFFIGTVKVNHRHDIVKHLHI